MKKILTVLALCACVAFAGTATETLLEETVFQPDQKNFRFWKVKELTAATTVKDGIVKIEFKADASKKPNLYNAQFIVPYEKGFKAGVKYRVEVTLKSSADLKIAMNVSLNRNPWTSLRGKTIQLKEGVPTVAAINFSTAEELSGHYRVPMLAFGLAQPGSTVEISGVKLFEVK